jgi:hypothetical protein
MCSLYKNECSNLKQAEATMERGLGSSDKVLVEMNQFGL